MTANMSTMPHILLYLAQSSSFSLDQLPQPQVRKFVDLVALMIHNITHTEYYELMFNKMWSNKHAKEYLLSLSETLS